MRRAASLILALALSGLLTGCAPKEAESQIFAMDTFMNLTVYGKGHEVTAEEALDTVENWIYELENELSVTRTGSDVHNINANCGQNVPVSQSTASLLERTLALCEETGGALDITAYPAVLAWGFTTGEYQVPTQEELDFLARNIDYSKVTVTGDTVTSDTLIDLGAVAKGYTGEVLANGLREMGIPSACLSLGGNVQTVGSKPDGTPWRVGIQDPESGGALAVVEVTDQAVVTSGNYQRYFEQDGQTYWHIIDPETAAPAQSGLASVSVIGSEGTRCDALSTALFVMGLEESAEFWREHRDFEAVFLTGEGEVYITAGLEDSFSLTQDFKTREVTVLE